MKRKPVNKAPFDNRYERVVSIDRIKLNELATQYGYSVKDFDDRIVIESGDVWYLEIENFKLLLWHNESNGKITGHKQRYFYDLEFVFSHIKSHDRYRGKAL